VAPDAADLLALLGPLLDGAFEQPLWSSFLDRLRETLGADYASLIFRAQAPLRPSLVHLYSGEPSPPLVERLYRESLHQHDPVPYHALAEGHVYTLDDFFREGDPEHDAFRAALWAPSGVGAGLLMRVVEPGGVNVWLSITRGARGFAADDQALLAALAPYLRGALRGFVALERERFNASVAGEAIRRLNFGWITLDAAGRVLESDAQGELLLSGSGLLRLARGGRLATGSADRNHEIAEAVKALAADPRGRPRALVLSRDPWLDMLLLPAHGRSIPAGPPPAVIAYVHGDSWSSADRCEQIAELFELLPSEARLALALSRGMSIAEAAADLGLTIETARSYSKRIYAKTGARGQPDLVRFIHRSVLAIA
jgi:DNA-binding CsgD family transcriptional regulator